MVIIIGVRVFDETLTLIALYINYIKPVLTWLMEGKCHIEMMILILKMSTGL